MGKIKVNVSVPGTGTLKTAGCSVIGMIYKKNGSIDLDDIRISAQRMFFGDINSVDILTLLAELDDAYGDKFTNALEAYNILKKEANRDAGSKS